MQIYVFMLCWVIFWGILSQVTSRTVKVATIENNDTYEQRANLFMAFIAFSVIIFFAGLRSGVADTYAYIKTFNELPLIQNAYDAILGEDVKGPGFKLFSMFIKTYISDDFHVWLFIIATISGICTLIPLRKYSCNYGISIFLFMASCTFMWMFNGIRQFIVASIIFLCTEFILEKRMFLYIFIILILSTIHSSALIMIPMYFIVREEPWNKTMIAFSIVIILAMMFTNQFTSLFNEVVENTSYAESIEYLAETDDGTNIFRILVEAVPVVMAFIYRNQIKDKLTPIIKICINMSFISLGLYIISKIVKSGIMIGRLPIYFSMYNFILLPWLLNNIFEKNERRLLYYIMIICYAIFFYYQVKVTWLGIGYISDILNLRYY